jgi:hypothetical protein
MSPCANAQETTMPEPSYLLDNAWQHGRARLDRVEALLDPGTFALLERIGVAAGWHCLELGAGGGSVAASLPQRIGAFETRRGHRS